MKKFTEIEGGRVKKFFMRLFGYSWAQVGYLGCCRHWTNCNHWKWVK